MKKSIWIALLVATFCLPVGAQNSTTKTQTNSQETTAQRFGRLLKKTKDKMVEAGHNLGDALGFDDRVNTENADSVRIDGAWLMPIYDTNLYQGSDALLYTEECRKLFSERYPEVEIKSVVLPQTDWLTDVYKTNNKVTGYLQTMYCYVIGRDGNDGYINARFVFQRYKEVGKTYQHVKNTWPKWDKTDVLTNDMYNQLTN